ncbi:unnamed protein product [Pylaiella littoralis]
MAEGGSDPSTCYKRRRPPGATVMGVGAAWDTLDGQTDKCSQNMNGPLGRVGESLGRGDGQLSEESEGYEVTERGKQGAMRGRAPMQNPRDAEQVTRFSEVAR